MTRPYRKCPAVTAARQQRLREKWLPIAEGWAAQYRAGMTLQEIGALNGITRERVRQIMTKYLGLRQQDGGKHAQALARIERLAAKRDALYLAKKGCTFDQYKSIPRKATHAFSMQQKNAKQREIPWEFTLWQWWTLWQESGRWSQRGRGSGYVMCRKGDVGPYSVDNVFIATGRENSSDQTRKSSGLPTGVSMRRGKFIAHAHLSGKNRYLGSFSTALEAHVAYLRAVAGFQHTRFP